jgi:GNAT superfamily N-acetyltransferase
MDWIFDEYVLTDERERLDIEAAFQLLATTYWAVDRPREVFETAVNHSICCGLFHGGKQIGFCRAVTDHATFTWICDVIVHPEHRGRGLGKWMVQCLINHPRIQTRTQLLATRDAHGLYQRFGFGTPDNDYLKRSLPLEI